MSQPVTYHGYLFVALAVLDKLKWVPAGTGTAFVDPQPPGPPTLISAPDKLVGRTIITVTLNPGGIAALLPFLKPYVRLGGFAAVYLEKWVSGNDWTRVGEVWRNPQHGLLHQVYACPGFASLKSGIAHTIETRYADTEVHAAAHDGFSCWGPIQRGGYRLEGWVPEKGQYRTYVEVLGPGDKDPHPGWSDPTKVN